MEKTEPKRLGRPPKNTGVPDLDDYAAQEKVKTILKAEVEQARRDPMYLLYSGQLTVKGSRPGQMCKFVMNKTQRSVLNKVQDLRRQKKPVRVAILKGRQFGISTLIEAVLYSFTSLRPNLNALIAAHDDDGSNYIFGMTKLYHEKMLEEQPHLTPARKYSNEKKLAFEGIHSEIRIQTARTVQVGRGYSLHMAHLSEAAYFIDFPNLMLSLNQAIHDYPETMLFIETTGNGENEFCSWWRQMRDDRESGWLLLFLSWKDHEEYQRPFVSPAEKEHFEKSLNESERALMSTHVLTLEQMNWRRYTIRNKCNGSLESFQQEYPLCISGDERIGTSLGILRMRDISPGIDVHGGTVSAFYPKGTKSVVRVRTEKGYEFTATPEHRFRSDRGWIEAGSSLGSRIELLPPATALDGFTHQKMFIGKSFLTVPIDEEWGRFLGYFMGDGSFHGYALSIACDAKDRDVVDDVERLIRKLFSTHTHARLTGDKKGCLEVRSSDRRMKDLFLSMGLLRKAPSGGMWKRNIHVPECIWRSPKNVMREFLKGLFEADGFNGYGYPRVVLFSRYPEFIRDVQLLLLAFGITSTHKRTDRKTYEGHSLLLRCAESLAFNERIGFISKRKRQRHEKRMPIRYRHAPVTLMDRVSSVCDAGDMDVFDLSVSGEPVFSASGFAAHNCEDECFKATGARVFPEQIVAAQNAYVKPPLNRGDIERVNNQPVFMPQESGSLRIWDFPKKGHLYVIGADASGGVTDNASAQVIDRTTWKQVATLSGLITADVFGERLFNLGALYNWAEVIPESNNHGLATVLKLRDMGYPNIGRRDKMIITDEGREEEEELGWNTNSKTKPVIIMGLYQALRENLIQVQEQETVDEIRHYYVLDRSKTGYTTYGAGPGFHDDRVMSLAIALKYAQELPDQSPQQTPARPGRETVGITGY